MKVDAEMRFPHPVLWSETGDYNDGVFDIAVFVNENVTTGAVDLKCEITLTEASIRDLCTSGKASVGLSIVCLETYYSRLHELSLTGGTLAIAPGLLRGVVRLRPIIWANAPISGFVSPNVHEEFGAGPLSFGKSAILGFGDESEIDVGAEKLAPIASLFTLARDDAVPEQEVRAQLEEDKIQILAKSSTLDWISKMRSHPKGKAILLSAVYMPVLMIVLDAVRSEDPVHQSKRWYRVITAKLTALGLKMKGSDLLLTAQRLFRSPLGKLESFVESK